MIVLFQAVAPSPASKPSEGVGRRTTIRDMFCATPIALAFVAPQLPLVLPRRASVVCSEADDQDLRASLESLFGKSTEDEPARVATLEGDLLRDLPLWRVQWPASPGGSQVYNVHVPHYTHMFSTLDAASSALGVPGLFGHLLLPGGSANLGEPEYALQPGTKAPLIGVVMQVIEVMAQPDGRLQVVAAGLCRFEVAEATQTTPYSRADVRLLPDDDEVSAYTDQSSRVLARVAAGAASLEWASQEARPSPCSRAARRRRRGTSDRRCVRHSS